MQDKIFDMLLQKEEVGWKEIIYDLIRTEQMDPWDIDVTFLAHKYIGLIKKMKEHDLLVSGKVLLAAAILLKMKSSHLIDNDIARLDELMNPIEDEIEDELWDNEESFRRRNKEKYTLIPRNPQPRNRKVSIHDLVNALQRAMSSKKRVLAKIKPVKFDLPKGTVDIMAVIEEIYQKVVYYSKKEDALTFSKLLPPKAGKHEKVYTFIPLLHLENERKIDMSQNKPFDEIHLSVNSKKKAK